MKFPIAFAAAALATRYSWVVMAPENSYQEGAAFLACTVVAVGTFALSVVVFSLFRGARVR